MLRATVLAVRSWYVHHGDDTEATSRFQEVRPMAGDAFQWPRFNGHDRTQVNHVEVGSLKVRAPGVSGFFDGHQCKVRDVGCFRGRLRTMNCVASVSRVVHVGAR
jgi:hypothetical protein